MIQANFPPSVASADRERPGRSSRDSRGRPGPAERDYYRRREAQEWAAARAAATIEARSAHEQLARAYRRLTTTA